MQKCAACQDLPTLQFWSKSHYPFWSYFPFFIQFSKLKYFSSFISKTMRQMVSWNCKHVQHVKIYLLCNFDANLITHLGLVALFSSIFFLNFNTVRVIFQKLLFPTVKNVWRVFPLEMHLFVDSLLLVTQIIKGKQLYYKMWSRKS